MTVQSCCTVIFYDLFVNFAFAEYTKKALQLSNCKAFLYIIRTKGMGEIFHGQTKG